MPTYLKDVGAITRLAVSVLSLNFACQTASYSFEYLLPDLPNTSYTLDNVFILPRNNNSVEISVSYVHSSNPVLPPITFTLDSVGECLGQHLRLDERISEYGIAFNTTGEVHVYLMLTPGPIEIPATSKFACHFFTVRMLSNTLNKSTTNLAIYPSKPNTTVFLCPRTFEQSISDDHLEIISEEIPNGTNCTSEKIYDLNGLFLNSVSNVDSMEIFSDKPVYILIWNIHSVTDNPQATYSPRTKLPSFTYRKLMPVEDWSNHQVLIPDLNRRKIKLWLLCLQNSSIEVWTGRKNTTFTVFAMIPVVLNFSLNDGEALSMLGTAKCIVQCSWLAEILQGRDDLCHFLKAVNYNSQVHSVGKNDFIIGTISKTSHMFLAAQENDTIYVVYTVNQLSEIVTRDYSAGSLLVRVLYCNKVEQGVHRFQVKYVVEMWSRNNSESCDFNSFRVASVDYNYPYYEHSDFDNKLVTRSETGISNTLLTKEMTSTSANFAQKSKKRNKKTNVNKTFTAVLEIIHHDTISHGIVQQKSEQSNHKQNPSYVIEKDVESVFLTDGGARSPLAVVITLVSAVVAVALLITVFLIREYMSRRQTVRNSRIRPFVSYY